MRAVASVSGNARTTSFPIRNRASAAYPSASRALYRLWVNAHSTPPFSGAVNYEPYEISKRLRSAPSHRNVRRSVRASYAALNDQRQTGPKAGLPAAIDRSTARISSARRP